MKQQEPYNTMSKTSATAPSARRYDDAARTKIVDFLKTGKTNREAKEKFGCTAHFAAKLREEAGIAPTAKAGKPAAAKAPKAKASKPAAKAPKAKASKPAAANLL